MYSQTKETVTVVKTFKFTLKTDEKPASRLSTFYLNVNRTIGTDDFNECLSPVDLKNRSWTIFNKQISKYTVGVPEPIVAALEDSWTSRLIARNTHLLAPCDALDLVYIGMYIHNFLPFIGICCHDVFSAVYHKLIQIYSTIQIRKTMRLSLKTVLM